MTTHARSRDYTIIQRLLVLTQPPIVMYVCMYVPVAIVWRCQTLGLATVDRAQYPRVWQRQTTVAICMLC